MASKRFRRSSRFIFWSSIIELALEHALHHVAAVGAIDKHECDYWISSLRSRDVPVYIASLMVSFLFSFVRGDARHVKHEENGARDGLQISSNVIAQMNQVLEEIKAKSRVEEERIRQEQDSLRKERDQFNFQMLQMHRQLNESYDSMYQHQSKEKSSSSLSLSTSNDLVFVSPPPSSMPRFVGRATPSESSTPVKKMLAGTFPSCEITNKRKYEVDSADEMEYDDHEDTAAKRLKGQEGVGMCIDLSI